MPKLSDPSAAPPVRALLIGDGGSGKTGALASLIKAGYNLSIADYDNGMEILRNILRRDAKAEGKPENHYLSKVDFGIFRDEYEVQGTLVVPKTFTAWANGLKYITAQLKSAGPNDIIIMDSLSFAAKASMVYTLGINNRLKGRPWESDWGDAQRQIESAVALLTSDAVKCHVICTAHIAYSGGKEKVSTKDASGQIRVEVIDNGPERGLPAMIGKALNPVIGRYFNHTLLVRQIGSGAALKQSIHTKTFEDIQLKNTNPGVIKPEYPLATGLADYFADARGCSPAAAKAA